MKNLLKKIIPKGILKFIAGQRYGFFGPYKNWQQVAEKTIGYDYKEILGKVKDALTQVKAGLASYERDSVLFYKNEYRWPLLANLLFIAGQNEQKLDLIDFGGSLGSSYFQHLPYLKHLSSIKWNIVEQPNFVKCGLEYFANDHLNFYETISACLEKETPSLVMFSSSLQYLENPYKILQEVTDKNFRFILFDRTSVTDNNEDFVTLQKVPPQVYDASYPCWFLSEQKLLKFLSSKYNLVADFEAPGGKIKRRNFNGEFKGYLFKRKRDLHA